MNPEADQPEAPQQGGRAVSKPRAGVPVWRTGKPDAFLAAAVDTARTALEGITAGPHIGAHVAAKSEGDRLVTHLFESKLPGYLGWHWYAVLTRNSRSKVVTVNELGLLPSEDSILAPEWVPWAERVRPEDAQIEDAPAEGAQAGDALAEGAPSQGGPGPEASDAVVGTEVPAASETVPDDDGTEESS